MIRRTPILSVTANVDAWLLMKTTQTPWAAEVNWLSSCSAKGVTAVCGNNVIDIGEQCDPPRINNCKPGCTCEIGYEFDSTTGGCKRTSIARASF